MSQRTDADAWPRLRSVEACVICRQGAPNDILVELETSWVTVNEDAPMRGYACLVFRRHAVELHDLTETEGAAFMRDIRRLSAALQRVTDAVKLNYEKRKALNEFIRTAGVFDGVVDFDKAIVDSATGAMKEEFVHNTTTGGAGDKLHPNRLGYIAMGMAIDLDLLKPTVTKTRKR